MKKFIFSFIVLIGLLTPHTSYAYLDDYDGLLKDYVKPVKKDDIHYNGVDYDKWQFDKRHQRVRKILQKTDPDEFKTKAEKLAFWINAYNFFTIDLIIQRAERDSIKDLGGVVETVWERFRWDINGTQYTLDNIEHDIIRKMEEPRIHFALNCAAKSCPDLRNEAYRANKLNTQLNNQVVLTLNNKTKGFARENEQNLIYVSKVMEWYEDDFADGNLLLWLKPWKPLFVNGSTKIKFFPYDWSLNSQEGAEDAKPNS